MYLFSWPSSIFVNNSLHLLVLFQMISHPKSLSKNLTKYPTNVDPSVNYFRTALHLIQKFFIKFKFYYQNNQQLTPANVFYSLMLSKFIEVLQNGAVFSFFSNISIQNFLGFQQSLKLPLFLTYRWYVLFGKSVFNNMFWLFSLYAKIKTKRF